MSCGRSNATEQKSGGDEPDGVDTEVVDNLRAALDVERIMAQQLTESLQHEQERVAQLTAELTRLSEQFAAECSLAVHSRNNVDSSTVSSLLNILLHSSMFMILSFRLDLRHFIHRFLISVNCSCVTAKQEKTYIGYHFQQTSVLQTEKFCNAGSDCDILLLFLHLLYLLQYSFF